MIKSVKTIVAASLNIPSNLNRACFQDRIKGVRHSVYQNIFAPVSASVAVPVYYNLHEYIKKEIGEEQND